MEDEFQLLLYFFELFWKSYVQNSVRMVIIPMETNFYHRRSEILSNTKLLEQWELVSYPDDDTHSDNNILRMIIGYCMKPIDSEWFESTMRYIGYDSIDGETWRIVDHFFEIPSVSRHFYHVWFYCETTGEEKHFLHERPWEDQSPAIPYSLAEKQKEGGFFDEYMNTADFDWDKIL